MLSHLKMIYSFINLRKGDTTMVKFQVIYQLVCYAYEHLLRALVKEKINDPNSEIDDFILSILDKVFAYEEKK
jgi:hypothetical protein